MKNHPEKHKVKNAFKFKSFADRICEVDIRKAALYHVEHANEEDAPENETEFHQCYLKWIGLNLSSEFEKFQISIRKIVTLPQLLHKKDFVIEHLLKFLENANTLSLEPLLDFVIALAKDLRDDFYAYFRRVLELLIKLLNTKQPDELEWTLVCLANLFKILKSSIKNDFSVIFSSILPLLAESNPEHITNFAAECFSFVARDIRDKEKFVEVVMKLLQNTGADGVLGCGRLFFEIIRGVSGKFHSCAGDFMTIVFNSFANVKLNRELMSEVVTQMVTDLLDCVKVENIEVFWDALLGVLIIKCTENRSNECIEYLLQFVGQAVEYKNGVMISDASKLVNQIISLLETDVNEKISCNAARIGAVLLLAENVKVSQLDSSRLCRKILTTSYHSVFEEFVWNTVNYSQFDMLIFPEFLKYFNQYFSVECLGLLVKIIVSKSGHGELGTFKKVPIQLKSHTNCLSKIKDLVMNPATLEDILDNSGTFVMAILFYTHAEGLGDCKDVITKAKSVVQDILKNAELEDEPLHGKEIEEISINRKQFFTLSALIQFLICSKETIDVQCCVDTLLPYCRDWKYIHVLEILDTILSNAGMLLNKELFDQIHPIISANLSSPSGKLRLLSAHILSLFPKNDIMKKDNVEGETRSIYELIFAVESVTPNIHNYRELLQILDRFNFTGSYYQQAIGVGSQTAYDPLKYLLGVFYVNFKLLWEPTSQLIAVFAANISPHEIWNVIRPALTFCDDVISGSETFAVAEIEPLNCKALDVEFTDAWSVTDRPDFINYRVLLLNAIASCGQLAEIKNKEIITLFLKFWDSEFKRTDDELKITTNVLKSRHDTSTDDHGDHGKKKNNRHLGSHKTLTAYLQIFAKIPSPKSNYKEPALNAIYHDLLFNKNVDIQKLALDCIVAYKHKYLTPYKDNLYQIINESTFRAQMVSFRIDPESQIVQDDHRKNFMPILFRILQCKMGIRINSKQESGLARKTLILRFLTLAPESEFLVFVQMLFKHFNHFVDSNLMQIRSTIELENILHPKKLQSAVGLIEIIIEQFCGLASPEFLRYVINILCGIGATINAVLENSYLVDPKYVTTFKKLRSECTNIVTQLFAQFDSFPWETEEIELLFALFVWPSLTKLAIECIHSPTPLLKLLLEFSKNPRYHVLLANQSTDEKLTPLACIMALISNSKSSNSVVRIVMDIIDNLLTLDLDAAYNDEEERKLAPIDIPHKIQIDTTKLKLVSTHERLNYGSCILLPYIADVLERMRKNLILTKSRSLNKRDMNILSRVTELVTDSDTSDKLLFLLYPVLSKKTTASTGDDFIIQMITTLTNLILKSSVPEIHIRNIAPLFESVSSATGRKMLCQLITKIAPKTLAEITNGLNAMDQRWIDQPDYEKRLDTMRQIGHLTKSGDIDMNLCLIIIHHCFYFLKHDKDLAIRDSSGFHLKSVSCATLLKYHSIDDKEVVYLIENVILNIVRRTLRDKNDAVRNEGILLLGELARNCSHCHPILADLEPLTDKADREIDFFDNVTHLQSHRHGRAFLKFCQVAKTYSVTPKPRTLTQFILPLATHYICNEAYAKKHAIVEAAIQAIGSVCSLLPWFQYETLLKFYLSKLKTNIEYQKQIVRLVMSILDAFHFDLSKANVVTSELPKLEDIEDEAFAGDEKKEIPENEEVEQPDVEADENDDEEIDAKLSEACDVDDDDDEDETESPSKKKKQTVAEELTVLSPTAAKRLIETISHSILPALNNAIVRLTTHDTKHKINRKKRGADKEDEDNLRVPIALAIVKLLQKLPEGMLDHNLPGIFMKICTFLKSHLKSIRMLTRDILRKIMVSIGPSRLGLLLNHLTALLTRGYQCHVLTVTIHSVLDALKTTFKPGDIDKSLQNILNICLDDIFGKMSEEKEVEKLGVHTPEAKPSNKSYMTLNIVASNITESCLLDLMIPFKNFLANSQSKKVVYKVQESFQKIMSGLIDNPNISVESLLIFIYGITSESIVDLLPGTTRPTLTQHQKERLHRQQPDIFIIPELPRRRSGAVKKIAKSNNQANAHILIEFALDMLHVILKRKKYGELDCEPYLDPIVPILEKSLHSPHVRVSTYSLKNLSTIWDQNFHLPNLETLTPAIAEQMFKLLHKYSSVGMSSNDENYHLIKSIFKGMMGILRFVNYYTITESQLKTLLLYVEQDLHSNEKQSFAFSLLKAILGKKLIAPEVLEIMQKVAEISIQSESSSTREETRSIFLSYLINYPIGKKVLSHLKFFVNQLEYEVISGRQSAISTLGGIIKKFPIQILQTHAGFLFLSLAARLVNDDVAECRIQAAETIELLLTRLDQNMRNQLFDIAVLLLNDKKLSHREMAAQLFIRYVNVEKLEFKHRLKMILPNLVSKLTLTDESEGGKFVKIQNGGDDDTNDDDEDDDEDDEFSQKLKDHQLIQLQNCIIRILETFEDILTKSSFSQFIDDLAYQSQTLLAYDHVWVRLNSAKILQFVLITTNTQIIEQNLLAEDEESADVTHNGRSFLYNNSKQDVKSLVIDHFAQLFPDETDEEMTEQVMKNVLLLANFVKNIPFSNNHNIISILRRIRFVINAEVAKAPHSLVLRMACFNWIGSFITMISTDQLKYIAEMILAPLVREMNEEDTTIDPKLRQHANKIGNKIKKRLGEDDYNSWRSKIQVKQMMKRAERRKELAQEKINDPERAANRKFGMQNRKKMHKKRKLDVIRGKAVPTKKRRRSIDDFF